MNKNQHRPEGGHPCTATIRRKAGASAAFSSVLWGSQRFASAQRSAQEAYPSKPVKIIVGMPAGTFTDLSARLIGDSLRADLRESFIVENRPGAATNIATQAAARAPKDGYTLLLSTNSNAMNVSLFKDLPFDVVKDFAADRDDRRELLHPVGGAVAAGIEPAGADRLCEEPSG